MTKEKAMDRKKFIVIKNIERPCHGFCMQLFQFKA